MDQLGPGTVLLGKYRIDEVLGVGGMGRVLRASHIYLQQSFAIKALLPEMAQSASTVSRFLREAQATVSLKSEHIARVIDVATLQDGTPFMVMEYLNGNDLNQILRHHGPQTPAIVCDLMLQACEGMAEAHAAGVVHRDIKPSNFFITQRPDGSMLLKILDFGISKTAVGITELTGTQTVLGTPTYMAPEQMKSGRTADARSDIWSIGVVMYQMLNGRPPFNGESYAELVLQVNGEPPSPMHVPLPAGLGEVILRCLEKDPKNRQQNVGELARMLAPFATDPIAAALSAARATRILQHKAGSPLASPLTAHGGLTAPVPLSPAQLTPRSWPPSSTSLSHTAGQVTYQTRGGRGWMIAGVACLVVLAGAGGFIFNEVMKDGAPESRSEAAPPPRSSPLPTAAAATEPPAAAATEPSAASPPPPAAATTEPSAASPPPTAAASTEPSAASPPPTTPASPTTTPTTTPSEAAGAPSPTFPDEPKAADARTADARTAAKPAAATKPAPRPAPPPATKPEVATRPAARPAIKADPAPKPAPKAEPKRPKGKDDLFDTRH